MGFLSRLIPMKAGDRVEFKRLGTPATVLRVEFQSAFVEFVSIDENGVSTGRTVQNWVEKSKLRKV
jgi:hypothetical protein